MLALLIMVTPARTFEYSDPNLGYNRKLPDYNLGAIHCNPIADEPH
jgi:hypothetical protein